MPIPAQHLQDLVADYLRRHPDEQPVLRPLVDRLAAGANVKAGRSPSSTHDAWGTAR
ncbi:hypothetical protein ACIQ7Q_20560 [Streptomyces sp. NPDC096176]|uniref:hypothetical protein n=1 Tax=Streptomyces sp. NPDC096176 TaxID=3366079 RepID=UPI003802454A